MVPYQVPQLWASRLADSGFGAVLHRLRFSPHNARGLALFGAAGESSWPVDPAPVPAVTIAAQMGVHVVFPPDDDQIAVIDPP